MTLAQGEPTQVGDVNLTFTRFIPRQGLEKERMEVKVVKANGSEFFAYPSLFMNQRTRQVMAHPDVRSSALQDLYISPIEYEPGTPAGAPQRIQLAQGETYEANGLKIAFAGFDLQSHNSEAPMLALENGQAITVGAAMEVTVNGETQRMMPLYSFTSEGAVTAQPLELPGGGRRGRRPRPRRRGGALQHGLDGDRPLRPRRGALARQSGTRGDGAHGPGDRRGDPHRRREQVVISSPRRTGTSHRRRTVEAG